MTELFTRVRAFVEESFSENENAAAQMVHFDRTVYWVQQLKPGADEAYLIAAIGHDIERAFRRKNPDYKFRGVPFTDSDYLAYHSEEGARLLGEFLKKEGADPALIERVQHLVSKHEVGGDADQNLLMDADSISFVENNGPQFIEKIEKMGYETIKEKLDWMYTRISSEKAKDIARPMYEQMMKELDGARK